MGSKMWWCALGVACAGPGKESGAPSADSGSEEPLDLATDLAQPGPYGVGFQATEVQYTSSEGPRTLRFAVWYPTRDTSGEAPRYNGLVESSVALEGAALADDGPFPAHVYSHGHQGYAEASGFWMEHLASHGFAVAAPDHTGNTTFDGGERLTEIYYLRAEDIGATIDVLGAPEGDLAFLAGMVDLTGLTASGHSFGGYTLHALAGAQYDSTLVAQCLDGSDTSAYCSTMTEDHAARFAAGLADPRIDAFISMAPGDFRLFGDAGMAAIDRPVLHMTGALDPQTGGDSDAIWAALGGAPHARVDIAGGGHQTFTDFSGVLETFDGLIEAERGFAIVDAYGLGWIQHQRGVLDATDLLDGSIEIDAAATVYR